MHALKARDYHLSHHEYLQPLIHVIRNVHIRIIHLRLSVTISFINLSFLRHRRRRVIVTSVSLYIDVSILDVRGSCRFETTEGLVGDPGKFKWTSSVGNLAGCVEELGYVNKKLI